MAKSRTYNVEVPVIGNIERSIRKFKKMAEREGVVRDMKRIVYFEKRSQKRRKQLMRAIKKEVMKNSESILFNR